MKSITPNLAVGGEGFYHLHKPLKGASLAARAVWGPKEEHVATVKAGSFGQAELSYQRKVGEKTLTRTRTRTRTLALALPLTLTPTQP